MDFGTPFAQARIPVRDLISPDFCSHYTTGEKIIRWPENYAAVEIISGGGIIIRGWRGRAKNSKKKFLKKSQSAQNCGLMPEIFYSIF